MADILEAIFAQSPERLSVVLARIGRDPFTLKTFGLYVKIAEDLGRDQLMEVLRKFAQQCDEEALAHSDSPDATQLTETCDEPELNTSSCMRHAISSEEFLSSLLDAEFPVNTPDTMGRTLLHHAAMANSRPIIKELLRRGANVNSEDLERARPIMVACRHGSVEAFCLLLCHTTDINHRDSHHQSALHYACKSDSIVCALTLISKDIRLRTNMYQETELMVALNHQSEGVVPLLIDYGVDVNARTRYGETALHYAAKYDCPAAAECLLTAMENTKVCQQLKDRHGYTPLAVAAKNGHISVVKVLLKYLTNRDLLNAETKMGNSPMDLAVMMGQFSCVQALISAGANLNIATSLIYAAQVGSHDILGLLIDSCKSSRGIEWYLCNLESVNKSGMAPLHVAAIYGHHQCVKLLLQEGANPCQIMPVTNETALMLAAGKNHTEVVSLIVDAISSHPGKCGLNLYSMKRKTALHYAATTGSLACAQILLDAGAETDIKDAHGYTPLLLSVERGHTAIVRLLLKAGCNINAERKQGWNALHLAALSNNTECGESLISAGLSVDSSSWISHVSPAILAAKKGHTEILTLLLDHSASLDWEDCDGATPLHHAAKNNHPECLSLLVTRGADIECTNHIGFTPLKVAAVQGSDEAVRWLLYYNASSQDLDAVTDVCVTSRHAHNIILGLLRSGCRCTGLEGLLAAEDMDGGPDTVQELATWCHSPPDLQVICRVVIRRNMPNGLHFRNGLHELPIPKDLQRYVGMERDLGLEDL